MNNTSLVAVGVPSKHKITRSMPISKNGQLDYICSYRPMSNLPSLSNIIANNSFVFPKKFNIVYKCQLRCTRNKNGKHMQFQH